MKVAIRKAEEKANTLLHSLGFSTVPVQVEKIAAHFGITISYDLGDDISGLLICKKDVTVIGVNLKESVVRQRFTIAHELGHYTLHRGKAELFVDKDYIVMKRSGEKDALELEANAFAAALLMPLELIESQLLNIPTLSTEEKIKSLAKSFQVSTIAMTYRLSNLGLL